jgi:hypothetical protein
MTLKQNMNRTEQWQLVKKKRCLRQAEQQWDETVKNRKPDSAQNDYRCTVLAFCSCCCGVVCVALHCIHWQIIACFAGACTSFHLCPDFEQCIPGTCAQRLSVFWNSQAWHTIVMSNELINQCAQLSVPNVAIVIIITCEQHFSCFGEGHWGDTTQNLVIAILVELRIGANIEQATGW